MEKHDEINNKNVPRSLVGDYGTSDSESEDIEGPSSGQIGSEEYDHTEHSEMVLKNNIINACAHGPLSSAAERDTKSATNMIIDDSDSDVVNYEVTEYRDVDSESYSTPSSDSSDDEGWNETVESNNSSGDEDGENKPSKVEPIKVHGELGLDDLPPIEDLAISLPAQDTTKIGTILNIVDRLVIIRAMPETPAVDLESILFLDNGARALGKVFDVFGPVTEPHYCVRFNSVDHVKERGVQPGMDVYIAPRSRDHTNYVFLTELMKSKGSDASWLHDIEPPPSHVDYSDDEEERRANRARKEQNKKTDSGETSKTNSQPPKRDRRNQRPSESSNRFGGYDAGYGRGGLNPFSGRRPNTNPQTRFVSPWSAWAFNDTRTPPHPNDSAPRPFRPPPFNRPPMCVPPFDPYIPPPFVGDSYQFGGRPRMFGPIPPMSVPPPLRPQAGPVFGAGFCTAPGPQPQWARRPPPPPGT
ncbi:H/ACA ribonucleoprotein complex non-core subunit NAF1 [Papilio machaon]|uniref:H/ACA ribonucleoprotein complex non-core subunit NAF1 n=1 Tax=Papilio machaon TaxID=76193 RepID=A0A0N0PCT5_PAPMA|nr:H/ACA ribonucleoprotein complex non-core subunit NAF1 [Papilio machaon]